MNIKKTDKYSYTPKEHFINTYNVTVDNIIVTGSYSIDNLEITLLTNSGEQIKTKPLFNKIISGLTYSQIKNLKNTSSLKEGFFYELKRRHKQSFSGLIPDYSSSNYETFLLYAENINTISEYIISLDFLNDNIFYNFDNDVINYRKDLINSIETNYDFREVVFVKFENNISNLNTFQESINYNFNDYVQYGDNLYCNTYEHLSSMNINGVLFKDVSLYKTSKQTYSNKVLIGKTQTFTLNSNFTLHKTFSDLNNVKNVKIINNPSTEFFSSNCFINNGELNDIYLYNCKDLTFINTSGSSIDIRNTTYSTFFNKLDKVNINNSDSIVVNNSEQLEINNSTSLYIHDYNVNNKINNSSFVYLGGYSHNNKIINCFTTYLNDYACDNTITNTGVNFVFFVFGLHTDIYFTGNTVNNTTLTFLGKDCFNNNLASISTSYFNINNTSNKESNNTIFKNNNILGTGINIRYGENLNINKISNTTTSINVDNDTILKDSILMNNRNLTLNNSQTYDNLHIMNLSVNTTVSASTKNNHYYFLINNNGSNNSLALKVTTGGTFNGVEKLIG